MVSGKSSMIVAKMLSIRTREYNDRTVIREMNVLKYQFHVSDNHIEDIIEVMGNASGKRTNGFHLLGLAELVFKLFAVRNISGNASKTDFSVI